MRLIVDVARAEPLVGSVRSPDGEAREFTTWLGLMAVLRSAIGEEPAAGGAQPNVHHDKEQA